jgi:hypothetical protein
MQRTDGQYLYGLGHQIHSVATIKNGSTYGEILGTLWTAEQALAPFLNTSIYQLRYCQRNGQNLLSWVKHVSGKAFASDLANDRISDADLAALKNSLSIFETNLASEFALMDTYLVAKKGGYDTADLIENGGALFQASLGIKVPGAVLDVRQATRCIAFEVPTAAGFHLHRANEAVLHAYFDAVRGSVEHPKDGNRNMGGYLALMDKNSLGDERVRTALRDIKNLHRNPLIHPDHSLETVDEATDLLGAIRAAIGAMLPKIPEPAGPLLSQMFAEPEPPAPPSLAAQ